VAEAMHQDKGLGSARLTNEGTYREWRGAHSTEPPHKRTVCADAHVPTVSITRFEELRPVHLSAGAW